MVGCRAVFVVRAWDDVSGFCRDGFMMMQDVRFGIWSLG